MIRVPSFPLRRGPGEGSVSSGDAFQIDCPHGRPIVLRYSVLEPPERRSEQVAADYARWFLSRLRGVDAVVSQQPTMCAGRFTVADISVGFALMLAEFIGLDAKFSPAVADYWQLLKERDGFRRAITRQDADPSVLSVRKFLKQD